MAIEIKIREEERVRRLMEGCVANAFRYLDAVNLNFVRALKIGRELCLKGRPGCPGDFQAKACASYIDLAMLKTSQLLRPVEVSGKRYIEIVGVTNLIRWLEEVDPELARAVTGTISWLEGLLGRFREAKLDLDGFLRTVYAFEEIDPEDSAEALERAIELVLAKMEVVLYNSIPEELYNEAREIRRRARTIVSAELPPLPPHPGKTWLGEVEVRVMRKVVEAIEEAGRLGREEVERLRRKFEEYRRKLEDEGGAEVADERGGGRLG